MKKLIYFEVISFDENGLSIHKTDIEINELSNDKQIVLTIKNKNEC